MSVVELSTKEVKTLLWHIDVIHASYGGDGPDADHVQTVRAKLRAELRDTGFVHDPPDLRRERNL